MKPLAGTAVSHVSSFNTPSMVIAPVTGTAVIWRRPSGDETGVWE